MFSDPTPCSQRFIESTRVYGPNGGRGDRRGFTFIEILMTLAVVAVLFVPVMQLFNHSIFATTGSMELITATSLAKSEMEKTINLNLSKEKLKAEGGKWYPPLDELPMTVNGIEWRIQRDLVEGTDPLEIRVNVYNTSDMEKPVVTLVTLMEDLMWEMVKPVSSTE